MRLDIKIEDSRVREALNEAAANLADPRDMLRDIGGIIRRSVEKNFAATGRPDKWKESRRVKKSGGETLSDTGRLRRSIAVWVTRHRVLVGTSVKYGRTHQFGAKKGEYGAVLAQIKAHRRKRAGGDILDDGKKSASGVAFVKAHVRKVVAPWGDIPARPWLMIQDLDWPVIAATIRRHVLKG